MKTLTLPAPQKITRSLSEVLTHRRTQRNFSAAPLTDAELATLLWATAGETTSDGKRTAPSCLNLRAVSVFVLRADGAWRYEAAKHQLVQITDADLRAASTKMQHQFVDLAPITLVFVAEKTPRTAMATPFLLLDAGAMVENAALATTALGLAGVPRGSLDGPELGRLMKLPATYEPIFCFTVGRPA